jgi:DHA1 family multidrug resistance protein-like MFS transporter
VTAASPPGWRRNQIAVTGAAFIGFTGFTLVMPFLPFYFEQLGVTDTGAIAIWSGVSLGVTPAVTALMAPVWARVAERAGRKLMVARSLLSFVAIMSATAFVTAPWQVFALRALQGLFAGYGPIAMTMVAESAPADRTAAAIGWVHTAQRLGPALGPVIGGGLAHALGLRTTFLVAAGFYLAAFGLVILGYREPPRRPAPESEAGLSRFTFTSFRRVPNFVLFMGAIFALQMVDRSFGPILPIFLRDVGMAPDRVAVLAGVVFSVSAAAGAVGNQTSGWWLRRLPVGRLVPRTAAMAAVAAAVFGFAPALWVLLVAAATFGLGLGIATTSIYTAASLAVPVQARGLAFGYLTTAYLTALAISPVAAGLIGALNVRAVFVVDAIGLGAVAWALRRFIRPGGQE